ncbi:MAG: hypothetical protein ACLRON_05510 [Veillonella parvula]
MKVSDETMLFRKVDDEPMTAEEVLTRVINLFKKKVTINQSNLRVSYF